MHGVSRQTAHRACPVTFKEQRQLRMVHCAEKRMREQGEQADNSGRHEAGLTTQSAVLFQSINRAAG